MEPGDLIFISGIYNNANGMVLSSVALQLCMVCVYMQPRSIPTILYMWKYGWARVKKSWVLAGIREGKVAMGFVCRKVMYNFVQRVEVHESYKFEAKSYHSMEYHFRSINSWLAGECERYFFATI